MLTKLLEASRLNLPIKQAEGDDELLGTICFQSGHGQSHGMNDCKRSLFDYCSFTKRIYQ